MNDETKFWSQVETTDGCWLWRGFLNQDGYGRWRYRGRMWRVHRLAWLFLGRGDLSGDQVLDHVCRVRNCVNPDHMRAVRDGENTLAPGSKSPSALNLEKDVCRYGHPYDKPGRPGQHRRCRTCGRERARRNSRRLHPKHCVICRETPPKLETALGWICHPCADLWTAMS